MEDSNMSYMVHEVVKRTVLANWKSYLSANFDRLEETLKHAVINIGDDLSLMMVVDPKDLSLHEVGLMIGDAKVGMFTSEKVWFLQIPILDSANPTTLHDIEMFVDMIVQMWLPIDCEGGCSR